MNDLAQAPGKTPEWKWMEGLPTNWNTGPGRPGELTESAVEVKKARHRKGDKRSEMDKAGDQKP